MSKYKLVLFDAANTLIHKPLLWVRIQEVLQAYHYQVPDELLQRNHKMISEVFVFPDNTSADFYHKFNAELLLSLGIIPSDELLEQLFKSCSYLPWEKFSDTEYLETISLPLAILSNFNGSLVTKIQGLFPGCFSRIFISEVMGVAKPNVLFYRNAVKETGLEPHEILYIGDSLKLDVAPAQSIGMKALLIDRGKYFPGFENRISSLHELSHYLEQQHDTVQ